MYEKFFRLKEKPFKLVPDPSYLILSKNHEEAMALLDYGLSQGDGFIEITGEVGTGKTTLCRAFLEKLEKDEKTNTAYIFNPRLDEVQLLKSINDEFGIDSKPDTIKELIDILNFFLMEEKAGGKKAVLFVDEAQNLNLQVLEQLRLLSNLETSVSKLLQIVLVGQPELSSILNSFQLRQLGQRVTLSIKILPLTYKETYSYIVHRITLASQRPTAIFNKAAAKKVFRYSKGIPRLINIVCDRALLIAFVEGTYKIKASIAKKAIAEQRGRFEKMPKKYGLTLLAAATIALISVGTGLFYHNESDNGIVETASIPSQRYKMPMLNKNIDTAAKKSDSYVDNENSNKNLIMFQSIEKLLNGKIVLSRQLAVKNVLKSWGRNDKELEGIDNLAVDGDKNFFVAAAQQNGFSLYPLKGTLDTVKRIDLPAVFKLWMPERRRVLFIALSSINRDDLIFDISDSKKLRIPIKDIKKYWTGEAYIIWKNFYMINGTIPRDSTDASIIALKMLMRDIGFENIKTDAKYSKWISDNIKSFQKINDLKPDGLVGGMTKILLYNAKTDLPIPHIVKNE